MKANLRSGIVLATVVGSACSIAMAQPSAGRGHAMRVKEIHRITQSAQAPEPLYIEVNGVRYPYHDTGGSDDNFNIYQNGVGTTTHTAWFTGTQPLGEQTLDDISFVGSYGAGSGRLLNRMTLNITVAAAAPASPTLGVDVLVRFWNNLNPTGTPLVNTNENAVGDLRINFPAPTGGWAANTIYFRDVDLSTLAGGGVQTTSDSFAMEFNYLQPGLNPPFFHPDLALGFEGSGVENGTSQDVAWDDNASTPNGIVFEQQDAFNFGGAAGMLTNAAIALRANVPLPTGACCLVDGTCDSTKNVLTCGAVGGVYRGDASPCSTANCPPTGACCRATGTCRAITGVACAAQGGVYRGDSTCCTTANCLVGFDAGPPQTCTFNGAAGTALGLSSGNLGSSGLPFRYCAQPFSLSQAATITEIDIDAFVATAFDTVTYRIYNRHGDVLPNPVYATPTAADLVLASTQPYNAANLVADPRSPIATFTTYPISGLSINLPAGDYYLTIGASNTAGGDANFAWFVNAQPWTNVGNAPIYNFDSTSEMTFRGSTTVDVFPLYRSTAITTDPAPTAGPNPQDVHYRFNTSFTIKTSTVATGCYANCDQSTTAPILNVLDFSCFLNKFAAGDCYANCDGSTTPPVLNVLDFGCFLNRFAAGCT
jgi:hypothetical protein